MKHVDFFEQMMIPSTGLGKISYQTIQEAI